MQLVPAGRTARLVEESGALVATGDNAIDDDDVFGLIDVGAGDLRLAPTDAARLIAERFAEPLILGPDATRIVSRTCSVHVLYM